MRRQVESWRAEQPSAEAAKLTIYPAFIEGDLEVPKHLAWRVDELYFNPQHEEFQPRTMWSLSNAFTSAFKELDPIPQFRQRRNWEVFLKPPLRHDRQSSLPGGQGRLPELVQAADALDVLCAAIAKRARGSELFSGANRHAGVRGRDSDRDQVRTGDRSGGTQTLMLASHTVPRNPSVVAAAVHYSRRRPHVRFGGVQPALPTRAWSRPQR